jgi:small subunit ribosomal protein S16
MVTIRLARHGGKKAPFYRVVVADHRRARYGRFIERLGVFDPNLADKPFVIDHARLGYWRSNGAKPSATVAKLLKRYPAQA